MKFFKIIEGQKLYVPLINLNLSEGLSSPAANGMVDFIDLIHYISPHPISTLYAYCEDDSMIDACMPPGSKLVIDKSLTAENGNIVVAYINGAFTVKFIKFVGSKIFLIPANKKKNYEIIEVTEEMEMTIWGVVTSILININDN